VARPDAGLSAPGRIGRRAHTVIGKAAGAFGEATDPAPALRAASHPQRSRRRFPGAGRAPGSNQPGPGRRGAGGAVHPARRSTGHAHHRPVDRADPCHQLLRGHPGGRVLATDPQRDHHRAVDRHAAL